MNEWIASDPWISILKKHSPNEKVRILVKLIDQKMNYFFFKKKVKVKSTEPPWMTPAIKRKIRARKRVYQKEQRSKNQWKELKTVTTNTALFLSL